MTRVVAVLVVSSVSVLLSGACSSERDPARAAVSPEDSAGPAVLDPTGVLEWSADGRRYQLRFEPFDLPVPGDHGEGGAVRFGAVGTPDEFIHFAKARIALESFSPQTVRGSVAWIEGADRSVEFDLAPELRRIEPARAFDARDVPAIDAPVTERDPDDLVFCALGSGGTGLPGQRRVAAAVAKLASERTIDFVLLLGDSFYPAGPKDAADPVFHARFTDVYDPARFPMPFYVAVGDAEHRGQVAILGGLSSASPRWVYPNFSYDFEMSAHGRAAQFIMLDTQSMLGSVKSALTRRIRSTLPQSLDRSKAEWRFVCGHDPVRSHGVEMDEGVGERMRAQCEGLFEKHAVDVYIAGGDRNLQLLRSPQGTLHVVSGGAGGPEAAASVRWADDTVFASTGGGFTLFRLGREDLEISFHDVDGGRLYMHRLRKPR